MNYLNVLSKTLAAAILMNNAVVLTVQADQSFRGKCLLEVNHTKYLNGTCNISMQSDGSFSIGTSENEPVTYFAMVDVTGKNIAEGFWNAEKGGGHAHDSLGNLSRKGACWQNQTAKVCAWK
ncbi:hypothetical protein HUU62_10200 [Rhodoferax sp. 4810]|uniref:Uncharacterized protein n=1 Tax=Thiospirillum jenense TaxID=1653858 RepID=A0A839HIY2_9GAMM|nr:hypothetical protein [Thiospirillum jenense]MBB1074781.1 hypothetical protein [Rhodoferax jenense]MBB1126619.1 hypothetical protein [Thiospirillum jenense]